MTSAGQTGWLMEPMRASSAGTACERRGPSSSAGGAHRGGPRTLQNEPPSLCFSTGTAAVHTDWVGHFGREWMVHCRAIFHKNRSTRPWSCFCPILAGGAGRAAGYNVCVISTADGLRSQILLHQAARVSKIAPCPFEGDLSIIAGACTIDSETAELTFDVWAVGDPTR